MSRGCSTTPPGGAGASVRAGVAGHWGYRSNQGFVTPNGRRPRVERVCEARGMDAPYQPIRPITPPRSVIVDLGTFGPRRLHWGRETPLWARANGWRPTAATAALAVDNVMTCWGDWLVHLQVPLISTRGEQIGEAGVLVPPDWVRPA